MFRKHPNVRTLSDEQLAANYRQGGDTRFLGELYERYTDRVFLSCMKYLKDEAESEDATMQIFEKLVVDLQKYEIKAFKYWIYTVVRHHCLGLLDKRKKQREQTETLKQTVETVESPTVFNLNDKEIREIQLVQLEAALTQLKPAQRQCVELFYLQQKSYQEVSEVTGFSMKQVKSYIQNGKRNLKIQLEKLPPVEKG